MAFLLLAAVVVFNVDVIADRFRDYVEVVAVVRETSGVHVGSPVWVEGVEAGRVTAVEFMELDGRPAVALRVLLEDRARHVVRTGSRAHATKQRLIGVPTVQVSAGPAGMPPVEPGDTLYPADRPSVDMLAEQGKAFAPAMESLAVALGDLDRLIDRRRPGVAMLIDQLDVASDEAETLRADLEGGTIGRWARDPTLTRRIGQLNRQVAALSEAAEGIQRYGDPELRRSLTGVGQRARDLGTALDELEQHLTVGPGVLGRMQSDSAIEVAIQGVQAQIDSLRAAGMGFALRMFLP